MRPRRGERIESLLGVKLSRGLWVGWTGLGGATPCDGQARIRSHRPKRGVGGSRQVIMRTAPERCVSRILGQAPTQISCGFNYPSLLAEGQGVAHSTAMAQQAPDIDGMSSPTGRSHRRTKVCNTTYIIASRHTQPKSSLTNERTYEIHYARRPAKPWQRLYSRPDPQRHRSFRPILAWSAE